MSERLRGCRARSANDEDWASDLKAGPVPLRPHTGTDTEAPELRRIRPLRRDPRIHFELLADPLLERIHLRPSRRPRIMRRLRRRQRPPNRLAMQPRPPTDLPDRNALDPVQPPDLRPLLHADHTPSSSPDHDDRTRVRTRPDDPDPTPRGSLFSRRRWDSFQPAPTTASCDRSSWILLLRGRPLIG
jgi:hypothetical protein